MAKLILTDGENNKYNVNGRMSFEVTKGLDSNGNVILMIEGKMTTHKYIEDIISIESDRYILNNIEVVKEYFGTNDFDILYEFVVGEDDWAIKEDYLSEEAISHIEERLYKNDENDSYREMEDLVQQKNISSKK